MRSAPSNNRPYSKRDGVPDSGEGGSGDGDGDFGFEEDDDADEAEGAGVDNYAEYDAALADRPKSQRG